MSLLQGYTQDSCTGIHFFKLQTGPNVNKLSFYLKVFFLDNPYANRQGRHPKIESVYKGFLSGGSELLWILADMEKQEATAMITADLSAAFDAVNNDTNTTKVVRQLL